MSKSIQPTLASTIAEKLGCDIHGRRDLEVSVVSSLFDADETSITFDESVARKVTNTVGCVVARQPLSYAKTTIIAAHPRQTFARLLRHYVSVKTRQPLIHPTAVIDSAARIGKNVSIEAHAVIGEHAVCEEGTVIAAGVVIEGPARIGKNTQIGANTVIHCDTEIGQDCHIAANVTLGSRGFGYDFTPQGWEHFPQIGRLIIGNQVDIGPHTVIDRGALSDSVIKDGVKIGAHTMLGHGIHVGEHTFIAGYVGIAGSVNIGCYCIIGGGSLFKDQVNICDKVMLAGGSSVGASITKPGQYSSASFCMPASDWRKHQVILRKMAQERLDERENNKKQ